MDLPMDGLMCGGFASALIPASHPLFPKAGSTGQAPCWLPGEGEPGGGRGQFSLGRRWDRASCHGAGVWTAPCCPHPLTARPVTTLAVRALSPEYPRMGMSFSSQAPL